VKASAFAGARPSRLRAGGVGVIVVAGALALTGSAPARAGRPGAGHRHAHRHRTHHRLRRDHPAVRSWYVSASASAAGDGTHQAPFNSLSAVERASAAGDRIVILPSPRSTPPLDGGIALKPHQTLIGDGPAVAGAGLRSAPRVANTDQRRRSGDAVELADGVTVKNLEIGPAYRGGIYGSDVVGVNVVGNDVSGHNSSCTVGFVVLPFVLPTTLPGVGVPLQGGLPNGWAGIMVDASTARGQISIVDNVVHDAACGDGIDLRLMNVASLRARIAGNLVTRLRQGQSHLSLLAIGMQTQGRAQLTADLDHNTQTDIGSILGRQTDRGAGLPGAGADAEGVFANLAGSSQLIANVDHDTFRHGIGGFSVNGMEMVITSGNPTAEMRIANSSFSDAPGDLLEEINFGTGATMSLTLDHVIATHSRGLGNTYVLPGNNGDCLVMGHSGPGDSTSLLMRDTQLTDCINNGLTVASGVSNGGHGFASRLSFDIDHSQITGNRGDNLRVVTENGLRELSGKVQNTNISGARALDLAFDELAGTTTRATLDLGGGPLGSAGRNCIYGGGLADAEALGYRVSARNDWWGRPGGLAPAALLAVGGSLETAPALASPPSGTC
jgi:hypothetical protein